MKKLFRMIPMLLLSLCISFAACAEAEDPTYVSAEQEIMDQLLGTMGEDLIQRARDGGFQLTVSFQHGVHEGNSDSLPREDIYVTIDIRSAMGTVMYTANTVDCDLLAELESAAITSGIFALSEAEIAQFQQYCYTPKTNNADIYSDDSSVNLQISETPSNEAVVMLRHWNPRWKNTYTLIRSSYYSWDGLYSEVNF